MSFHFSLHIINQLSVILSCPFPLDSSGVMTFSFLGLDSRGITFDSSGFQAVCMSVFFISKEGPTLNGSLIFVY